MRGPAEGTLMTLAEAAEQLGVSVRSAGRIEQRALDKLREGLEEFRDYTPGSGCGRVFRIARQRRRTSR